MKPSKTSDKKRWIQFGLTHLYAAITGLIGLAYAFTFRDMIGVGLIYFRISTWSWQIVDLSTIIAYGLAWLVLVLFCQHKYEKQLRDKGGWAPRLFFYVTGAQAALYIATLAAIWFMEKSMT